MMATGVILVSDVVECSVLYSEGRNGPRIKAKWLSGPALPAHLQHLLGSGGEPELESIAQGLNELSKDPRSVSRFQV